MSSLHEFATWEPVLRLLRAGNADDLAAPGGYVAGQIGSHGWSLPIRRGFPMPGQAAQHDDMRAEFDAVQRVQSALTEAGVDSIPFTAEVASTGRTVLRLLTPSAAVESGFGGPHPGALVLVEGAVPEPWRRLPEPVPGAVPAPSADPALLERTLRERLPDAVGATDADLAAAEARLGVDLPEELRALYRVTRGRWQDWGGDQEMTERVVQAVGCELLSLDDVYIADPASRTSPWRYAAMEAVVTGPDATVQGVVGSAGWIVFADTGGGDRIAVDLTPGPRGHVGQIIVLSHEESIGAALVADSVTDLVLRRRSDRRGGSRRHELPAVARVNRAALDSIEAAVHPELEVLSIGVWEGEPLSLAPVTGLPRLRTLTAYPGTLAAPLEIAELTGLEFLDLGPEDWRVLLDAGAVPRGLSAASIEVQGQRHPLSVVDLANEILALWDRPLITVSVLEGDLGPLA
ncbi:SMI1/KNR4 family protein [Streptomyces phaeoluteigriseus]|uniref:SMI1/KNR4 family protein n=1 Tax=Streptomyces phaeoluteigriseus TaxID=114686 RepID=UPI0036A34128